MLTKSRNKEPLQKAKEAVNHTPKIKNSPRKTMIPMKQDVVIQIPTPTRHIRSVSGGEAALTAALEKEESSADSRIKIHTGPVDRTALTSHDPSITIKEIARILRILGIDTKDDGPFVLKCSRRKAKSFSTAESKADYESENNQRPPAGRLTGVSSFNNLRANGIISSFDFKPVQRIPEPIYGDASIDNGDEVRFIAEICRFRHLPGLYIVNIRRLKGNAWAYKFLYHKLIDFLDLGKDGYITMQL